MKSLIVNTEYAVREILDDYFKHAMVLLPKKHRREFNQYKYLINGCDPMWYFVHILGTWDTTLDHPYTFDTSKFPDASHIRPCVKLNDILLKVYTKENLDRMVRILNAQVGRTPNITSINPDIIVKHDLHKILGRVFYDACVMHSMDLKLRDSYVKNSMLYLAYVLAHDLEL